MRYQRPEALALGTGRHGQNAESLPDGACQFRVGVVEGSGQFVVRVRALRALLQVHRRGVARPSDASAIIATSRSIPTRSLRNTDTGAVQTWTLSRKVVRI